MIHNERPSADEPLGTLEELSLWYEYKTKVWYENSEAAHTVHNILRVLRATRNHGPLVYVSVPITSGQYFYNMILSRPDVPVGKMIKGIMTRNYWEGRRLLERLRAAEPNSYLYPADLVPVHQKWEEYHFQALWLSIIAEKCTIMRMCDGWEFSNGAAEEFTHVHQLKLGLPGHRELQFFNPKENEWSERERMRNIEVFDADGKPISIERGLEKIHAAYQWITGSGLEAPRLKECLQKLETTNILINEGLYQ